MSQAIASTDHSDSTIAAQPASRNSYRWLVFPITVLSTAIGMALWGAVFPLLNLWIRDFHISHAQGGFLFSLYFLPGFLFAIPGGWSFDRFPLRPVFMMCWTLIVIGAAVMAVAPNFLLLCAGRLLFAVGMNVHYVGAPKLLATWFEGRKEFGFVMGLYTWSYTIGIFSSLTFLGRIGEQYGWRLALWGLVALSIAGFVAMAVVLSEAHAKRQLVQEASAPFRPFQLHASLWLVALIWLFYNAGIDSYKTFTPDYLVHRGYPLAQASFLTGIYLWVGFALKPLFAVFITRTRATLFAAVGSGLGIAGYLLVPQKNQHPTAIAWLLGASIALVLPSITALPALILGGQRAGQGYGLCQLFYSLSFLAQPLIGYSIDITGGHSWAYRLMACYSGVALIAALFLVPSLRTNLAVAPAKAEP